MILKVEFNREIGLKSPTMEGLSVLGTRVIYEEFMCHTRFPEGNQMHLICVPGSSSTHMIDEMSVIS
jgi:hypothetical protein